jgi:hypothetical protein
MHAFLRQIYHLMKSLKCQNEIKKPLSRVLLLLFVYFGATTFSITALSVMTHSKTTVSITGLIATFSVMTLGIF